MNRRAQQRPKSMSTLTMNMPRDVGSDSAITAWTDVLTGRHLRRDELSRRHEQARRLYAVNAHIFEDELDALGALGVAPATVEPLAAA